MVVGNVSFGQSAQVVPQPKAEKSPGVVKNTVKAAALGATAGAVTEFLVQRNALKTVKLAGPISEYISAMNQLGKTFASSIYTKYSCERLAAIFKSGTYYAKGILKVGGVAAAVAGGIYLAYRGIKAMFS